MSNTFNIRSFVENQVERLSSSTNFVDKFRQTVDYIKSPFSTTSNNEREDDLGKNDLSANSHPSESSSNSSASSNGHTNSRLLSSSKPTIHSEQSASPNSRRISHFLPTTSSLASPKLLSNFKTLTDHLPRRQTILRRYVSESNQSNELLNGNNYGKSTLQPIHHNNSPIGDNTSPTNNQYMNPITDVTSKLLGRSRSLIRQSTEATCTFPLRGSIRRMESIETVEIPGLNGVKAIRYLNDNLGKLQPDLYMKQTLQSDPTYGCGRLTFTLFYNQQVTSLVVTILSIDNLPYRDVNSKILPDPFIKIILLPDRRRKFQTKVYKRTQSPHFNETFQFQINYEELCRRILLLSVYDFGRPSKRSLIGTVKIDDIFAISDVTSSDVTCIRSIVPGTDVRFITIGKLSISTLFSFSSF